MMKELKVIEPFFNLEIGDKLTLTEDGNFTKIYDYDERIKSNRAIL
nr:MAG TPA_asm: hypothetical protein [Bacteriophage sp.]